MAYRPRNVKPLCVGCAKRSSAIAKDGGWWCPNCELWIVLPTGANPALTLLSLPARIQNNIQPEPNSGCWLWTGPTDHRYGSISVNYKSTKVHRLVWTFVNGPIPEGYELHHRCGIKVCVNPDHLTPVLQSEHPDRVSAIHAAKTCCPFCGGPYETSKDGKRFCPARKRDYNRKRRGSRTWVPQCLH